MGRPRRFRPDGRFRLGLVWLLGASAFASRCLGPIDGSFEPGAKAPELIRSLKLPNIRVCQFCGIKLRHVRPQ